MLHATSSRDLIIKFEIIYRKLISLLFVSLVISYHIISHLRNLYGIKNLKIFISIFYEYAHNYIENCLKKT